MGRASEKFNEQLFTIKLLELPPLPRIDGSFFPTNAAIDSYPASLRERLEGIDRICRGIWQIQGKEVTPEFVREVLVPKVITQIDAVVGESVTRSSATDLERWGPAWAYLAGEVGELRSEFANRYEIEARELEYRNAPTESHHAQRQAPVSQPFDPRENLRDAILKKKARIAEIERILNRPPITEYRGRPVHGGQNWRLRLEEKRQHLLIAIPELERELEHNTAPRASSDAKPSHPATDPRERLTATVNSPIAAKRMETYLKSKAIGQTDFATTVGTTDRTLRSFRKSGKVRRDIFESIAKHMGTTKEALLKE